MFLTGIGTRPCGQWPDTHRDGLRRYRRFFETPLDDLYGEYDVFGDVPFSSFFNPILSIYIQENPFYKYSCFIVDNMILRKIKG